MLLLPNGEYVCPNDSVLALAPQGCVDGIYVPPQCQASPRTDCAVIYHSSPLYDSLIMAGGTLQQIVKTLRLPFVVAFINPAIKAQHINYLTSQGRRSIFWAITLEELPHAACNATSTGSCYARLQLPTYSYSCLSEVTLTPAGNYSCDYMPHPMFSMADPSLAVTAPRAYEFFQGFRMSPSDTTQLFDLLFAQRDADPSQYALPDYKQLACSWIHANAERWAQWVPPPATCSEADLEHTVSACDSPTATMTVSYELSAPKGVPGWASRCRRPWWCRAGT